MRKSRPVAPLRRSKRNQTAEEENPVIQTTETEIPAEEAETAMDTEEVQKDISAKEVEKAMDTEDVQKDIVADDVEEDIAQEDVQKEMAPENVQTEMDTEENENLVNKEIGQPGVDIPEKENGTEQTQQSNDKKKGVRGPTKMRKLAKAAMEKVDVDFSVIGEHSGSGSVTLSSFLGPLVREHVPVLVDDWREVDSQVRDTMWEEITARFNLEEGWQRDCVFKQMGAIWRASKSRLVRDLRKTKSATERLKLKPSNIRSLAAWNNWVKSKTSTAFKDKSQKYRNLRNSQIPHTTSRKGMFRLAVEMKKKSSDPRTVTRSKVWLAGHTHSDGRPVRKEFAEKIERIQTIDSQIDPSDDCVREDAVSQVLGKDKYGRVRGMGRGVSLNKIAYLSARDSHVQKLEASQADMLTKIEDLQNQIRSLAGKRPLGVDFDAHSDVSNINKGGNKCKILDWCSSEEVIVGEGEFCSSDQHYMIGPIQLGPNAAAVIVNSATNPNAFLWRPTSTVSLLGQSVGLEISWPVDKVLLDSDYTSPSGQKQEASDEAQSKCLILDWNGSEVVAEGLICSVDPAETVNQIPIGPNAVSMKVQKVIDHEAFLWRPTAEMARMGAAVNETIIWPLDKIEFAQNTSRDVSRRTSPMSTSKSTGSSKKAKKNCLLYNCNGSGEIVAEGYIYSTDPDARVHCVPLGPDASVVWVELSKIGNAEVWRPNAEVQYVDDAIGTTVAWPNDKLKLL